MTPVEIIVGLLAAAVASLGFAVMFRVRKKHLLAMAIGGLLSYAVYLITGQHVGGEFFSNLLASILAAVYCELCAQLLHAPVQIYLIPVLVPLFPGGSLYYAMYHLLGKDYTPFTEQLLKTLEASLGIAGGIIVGLSAIKMLLAFVARRRGKRDAARKKP